MASVFIYIYCVITRLRAHTTQRCRKITRPTAEHLAVRTACSTVSLKIKFEKRTVDAAWVRLLRDGRMVYVFTGNCLQGISLSENRQYKTIRWDWSSFDFPRNLGADISSNDILFGGIYYIRNGVLTIFFFFLGGRDFSEHVLCITVSFSWTIHEMRLRLLGTYA